MNISFILFITIKLNNGALHSACTKNDDCDLSRICVDEVCTARCTADEQCDSGNFCLDNICAPDCQKYSKVNCPPGCVVDGGACTRCDSVLIASISFQDHDKNISGNYIYNGLYANYPYWIDENGYYAIWYSTINNCWIIGYEDFRKNGADLGWIQRKKLLINEECSCPNNIPSIQWEIREMLSNKNRIQQEKINNGQDNHITIYGFNYPPVDCVWDSWSECSGECNGSGFRTRKKQTKDKYGGKVCTGESRESCSKKDCIKEIDNIKDDIQPVENLKNIDSPDQSSLRKQKSSESGGQTLGKDISTSDMQLHDDENDEIDSLIGDEVIIHSSNEEVHIQGIIKVYDCMSEEIWKWKEEKKKWCCNNENRGCRHRGWCTAVDGDASKPAQIDTGELMKDIFSTEDECFELCLKQKNVTACQFNKLYGICTVHTSSLVNGGSGTTDDDICMVINKKRDPPLNDNWNDNQGNVTSLSAKIVPTLALIAGPSNHQNNTSTQLMYRKFQYCSKKIDGKCVQNRLECDCPEDFKCKYFNEEDKLMGLCVPDLSDEKIKEYEDEICIIPILPEQQLWITEICLLLLTLISWGLVCIALIRLRPIQEWRRLNSDKEGFLLASIGIFYSQIGLSNGYGINLAHPYDGIAVGCYFCSILLFTCLPVMALQQLRLIHYQLQGYYTLSLTENFIFINIIRIIFLGSHFVLGFCIFNATYNSFINCSPYIEHCVLVISTPPSVCGLIYILFLQGKYKFRITNNISRFVVLWSSTIVICIAYFIFFFNKNNGGQEISVNCLRKNILYRSFKYNFELFDLELEFLGSQGLLCFTGLFVYCALVKRLVATNPEIKSVGISFKHIKLLGPWFTTIIFPYKLIAYPTEQILHIFIIGLLLGLGSLFYYIALQKDEKFILDWTVAGLLRKKEWSINNSTIKTFFYFYGFWFIKLLSDHIFYIICIINKLSYNSEKKYNTFYIIK